MVGTGAKVLGDIVIGANSMIGAGSVVLNDVPPNSTVVGVPGRVVKRDNIRVPSADLDQVHLPGPVMNDIQQLKETVARLVKQLEE